MSQLLLGNAAEKYLLWRTNKYTFKNVLILKSIDKLHQSRHVTHGTLLWIRQTWTDQIFCIKYGSLPSLAFFPVPPHQLHSKVPQQSIYIYFVLSWHSEDLMGMTQLQSLNSLAARSCVYLPGNTKALLRWAFGSRLTAARLIWVHACVQHYLLTMCAVVWKASSTIFPSWSDAAWWNTAKIFFQPERMLPAWEFTIWAIQRITMSRIVGDLGKKESKTALHWHKVTAPLHCIWPSNPHQVTSLSGNKASYSRNCSASHLFFFIICSKGLRKSFWKRKLANSPFSRNFIDSCLNESTAKMATSSLGLHPT